MTEIKDGARIERKYLAHYINATPGEAGTATYERLGKDLEEFNVELNANVETTNNILGESVTRIDSYQPSSEVSPYYAVKGSKLFELLEDIVDNRKVLDDLKTDVLEVHTWDGTTGSYVAYKEDAIIEVSSYGGDTKGVQIPFTIHYCGNRVKGTFNEKTNTFTPDSAAA